MKGQHLKLLTLDEVGKLYIGQARQTIPPIHPLGCYLFVTFAGRDDLLVIVYGRLIL